MIMFKTSTHDQCANVRLGRQIWHSGTDQEHLGTGLNQCANARLGVQIRHSRADRERLDSLTCSGHDQRANARSAHLIWHSRADREHLGFFYKKQSKKFKIGHTLGYLYLSVPFGNTLVKCSRSARECQIGCVDLAFAR